ncbi:hypothetical protein [Fodinibius sediminis]|uniref:Uncharacterized protein n=1 Tax=Fodinibius sediminis TaxID=1214077 RepID=A0A521BU94_9BACT|nr:hypothetical protein [Fodinibius sediminis]SMO50728.1 hypothetical protein SAMN06265218_10451 [Fodinibius sediminis]
MLTFYRAAQDTFTERIERKMKEMVVAHRLVCADQGDPLPEHIKRKDLPVLSDGHQVWTAPGEIEDVLETLHRELKLSQSLQSDTCHLDPDKPDQCL